MTIDFSKTKIEDDSFRNCFELKHLIIPPTVKTIDTNYFSDIFNNTIKKDKPKSKYERDFSLPFTTIKENSFDSVCRLSLLTINPYSTNIDKIHLLDAG